MKYSDKTKDLGDKVSLPARGAWIEMGYIPVNPFWVQSLPARGAWIEIGGGMSLTYAPETSLPARGAWIEIRRIVGFGHFYSGRSPHGERGLKFASL